MLFHVGMPSLAEYFNDILLMAAWVLNLSFEGVNENERIVH
jgi:hypothetical protein